MSAISAPAPLTVGFDLDMTLLDTRPGIKATYLALSAETGTYIDADLAVTRLGPPLTVELTNWFTEEQLLTALTATAPSIPSTPWSRPCRCPARGSRWRRSGGRMAGWW